MKNYPSDLTDTQWQLIEKMFDTQERSRKRKHSLRTVINAIWYVVKGGIQWRMLPKDFPKWQTLYWRPPPLGL
jgi:putative transposase